MNNLVKKLVIFSLIGVMQLGLGVSVTEASAHHGKHHEQRYEHHDNDREHRIQEERDRHEREMQRREHESEYEYRDRQDREREHHEEVMRTLGALALLVILNNN